jgi:S-adenosylmethionine:diacylglycerol 3-amino-3-carboxypropyl transferase
VRVSELTAAARRLTHTGVSDDGDVLVAALAPGPGRRFISISAHGAGEAALVLAGAGAAQVLAYDVADAQALLQLLTLKLSAAHLMGREDYLAVMGLRPASRLRRVALADQLLRGLPEGARGWWGPRRRWLVEGLFFADRQAAFFAAFQWALGRLVPEAEQATLLFGPDPEARAAVFRAYARRGWLERALAEVGARVNLFFPAPEWAASEYPRALNQAPLAYLEGLVAAGLGDSPVFGYLVRPRDQALPEALLPPHLRPGAFDGLRSAASRVRGVPSAPGAELPLADAPAGHHGAYLSNVVDYLTEPQRRALLQGLVGRLGPGAPVLLYSNEAYGKVPGDCGLTLDEAASAAARRVDRAAIYRRIEVYRTEGAPPPTDPGPRLRVVR